MSERYDYEESVKSDIKDYFKEHLDDGERITPRKRDELYDDIFVSDSVTGNASGSYYCNSWKSEESVCHNLDLLGEACDEFCVDGKTLREEMSGEWADVTIRCMMVGRVLDECVEEWNDAIDEKEESEEVGE